MNSQKEERSGYISANLSILNYVFQLYSNARFFSIAHMENLQFKTIAYLCTVDASLQLTAVSRKEIVEHAIPSR